MAKNKVAAANQDKPQKITPQEVQEKPQKTKTPEDQLVSLKTLNNILIKETIERREQMATLLRSKETIEIELARSSTENQMLEAENLIHEEQIVMSEIQRSIGLTLVSSQLRQQAEKWMEQITNAEKIAAREAEAKMTLTQKLKSAEAMAESLKRDKEHLMTQVRVLEATMKESVLDKEKIEQKRAGQEIQTGELRKELDRVLCEMDGVRKDLSRKKTEADGLGFGVLELEKSNAGVQDELRRAVMEYDGLLEEKGEMAKRMEFLMNEKSLLHTSQETLLQKFEALKREMQDAIKEKDEMERTRIEQDFIVAELNKEVGLLTAEISHDKDAFNSVLCERDAVQKEVDLKKEEADGLRFRIVELEKSNGGIQEELRHVVLDNSGLVEEKGEMVKSLELLMNEKALLHTSHENLSQQFGILKREMQDTVKEKDEMERAMIERDFILTESRKEVGLLTAEISRNKDASDSVIRERDAVQKELDFQKEEAEELKLKLLELEKSNAMMQEEIQGLQMERDGLADETEERKRSFETLIEEKTLIQRSLMESSQLIEDLKNKMRETAKQKEQMDQLRANQEVKVNELKREAEKLASSISILHGSCGDLLEANSQLKGDLIQHKDALNCALFERNEAESYVNLLKEEKEGLQSKVFEMEKCNAGVQEELGRLQIEFNGLVDEKTEKEKSFEALIEEKIMMKKSLDESSKQFKDLMTKMQEIINEKDEIEQVRIEQKDEIVKLEKEVSQLNTNIYLLHDSCRNHTETNSQLKADIHHYKDAYDLLMEEKTLIQRNFTEAQKSLEDMEKKIKSAEIFSELAVSMLKNTAEIMNKPQYSEKDDEMDIKEVGINGGEIQEEIIQPFEAEVERIKGAFRRRILEVQEMNQELKLMKTLIVEAQKKRNLWTWMSSATTIFASASVAYIARGR